MWTMVKFEYRKLWNRVSCGCDSDVHNFYVPYICLPEYERTVESN